MWEVTAGRAGNRSRVTNAELEPRRKDQLGEKVVREGSDCHLQER